MTRRPPCSAFTLIEMLVVMTVIAILTGLILSLNGLVQNTSARSRAGSEIRAMAAACEAYKADNGGYPQGSPSTVSTSGSGPASTDSLDPNPVDGGGFNANPSSTAYYNTSLFLWQQLSGHWSDVNPSGMPVSPSGTNYAGDFFKNTVLSGTTGPNGQITAVAYIQDPFGNSYGYSTAGLLQEQTYRANVLTGTGKGRVVAGFNSTFDLWSTGGSTTSSLSSTGQTITPKWVKNW
jgi:prepilin-type N-terminal cleavage/methylation domain-containing protein